MPGFAGTSFEREGAGSANVTPLRSLVGPLSFLGLLQKSTSFQTWTGVVTMMMKLIGLLSQLGAIKDGSEVEFHDDIYILPHHDGFLL